MQERLLLPERTAEALIGRPAIEVVKEIARRNPEIQMMGVSWLPDFSKPARPDWFYRKEIIYRRAIEQYIEAEREGLWPPRGFGLRSKVMLRSGEDGYIKMIDFKGRPGIWDKRIPWNRGYLQRVKKSIREMGVKEGVVIDSGRSLHYWSLEVVDLEDLSEFLNSLKYFTAIYLGTSSAAEFRPDHSWLYNCARPDKLCLRFTLDKRHRSDPVTVDVL